MSATRRACVIGWPISHSRSPIIHGHWLAHHGLEGSYTRVPVRPEDLPAFIASLRDGAYAGCNVTVPHKETVLVLADAADATARTIGAANTLWVEAGKVHATNTDTYGFMAHLERAAPGWRRDLPAVVLGAGGAARAVLHGLLAAGLPEVRLLNRSAERAVTLARHFGPRIVVGDWAERSARLAGAGLLVNTTTLGMKGAEALDIDLASLPAGATVYDIVYVPLQTPLLAAARARGLVAVDGLGMLLHQAVPGFERWFGHRPEVTDEVRALVVADLEAH